LTRRPLLSSLLTFQTSRGIAATKFDFGAQAHRVQGGPP
jgi:hypothetical protein